MRGRVLALGLWPIHRAGAVLRKELGATHTGTEFVSGARLPVLATFRHHGLTTAVPIRLIITGCAVDRSRWRVDDRQFGRHFPEPFLVTKI